jgi:hypothetical protein
MAGIIVTLLLQSLFGQRCEVCGSAYDIPAYRLQVKSLQGELEIAQNLLVECRERRPQNVKVAEQTSHAPTVHLNEQRQEQSSWTMGLIFFLVDVGLLHFCLHHTLSDETKCSMQQWAGGVLRHFLGNKVALFAHDAGSSVAARSSSQASPLSCQHYEIGTPRNRNGKSREDNVEILSENIIMLMLSCAAIGLMRILEILAGTGLSGHFVRYLAITMRVCLLVLLLLF